jgi:hypothetical protein
MSDLIKGESASKPRDYSFEGTIERLEVERDRLREQVATVRELRELDTKAWKAREAELLQILQRETGHDYVWNRAAYDQTD